MKKKELPVAFFLRLSIQADMYSMLNNEHNIQADMYSMLNNEHILGQVRRKPDFVVFQQQRHRPVCVSAQSNQHHYYSLFVKFCHSFISLKMKFSSCSQ